MTERASEHGQITKTGLSDGCGGKKYQRRCHLWYDRPGFEGYLGNVGLQDYKARIAALERLAGKLAMEAEFPKGALENARLPKNATSSVVAGPKVSPSAKDVD